MSLYRGAGGASDATDDSTVNAVAGYASSAASSASAAAASATTATNNATAAATSASQAASSTSAAATSASNAATSASNAAASASSASSSASSASTSATNASNSVGTVSTYASVVLGYRNTASTHATNAASSASAAAGSATSAANSAASALAIYGNTAAMEAAVADAVEAAATAQQESQDASDSAVAAAASEALAFEHEQNAAEWATTAQGSANSAQAYATSALAARDATLQAYDNFDDRYLGTKSSNPTTDNDGNPLVAGSLYFNDQTNMMMLYAGGNWVAAYTSGGSPSFGNTVVNGTLQVTGNTTLSGGTANGVAYLNGSKVLTTGSALTFDGSNLTVPANVQSGGNPVFYSYNGGAAGTVRAGIQMVGTDPSVRFTVNSTEAMRLTSTGLGIGTSSPLKQVHAYSSSTQAAVRVQGSGATSRADLYHQSSEFGLWGTEAIPFLLATNNTERLRIDSSGNVGIGTSSPAVNLQIQKAAADTAIRLSDGTHYWTQTHDTATNGWALSYDGGSALMKLSSTGNLGLGVTPVSGGGKLQIGATEIIGFQGAGGGNIASNLYYSGGWKYIAAGAAMLYAQSGGSHQWFNAASGAANASATLTQAMTLDASGRLLVGTTSASGSQVDIVDATGYNNRALTISRSSTDAAAKSSAISIRSWTNAEEPVMLIGAGIDDNTSNNVRIGGGFSNLNSATSIAFYTAANNTTLSGSERMRIDSSGNLGLGVTPSAWNTFKAFEIGQVGNALSAGSDTVDLSNNVYYATGHKYARTGTAASMYEQYAGQHRFYTAPSGTAGTAISFTQALTLNADGSLLLGGTSTPGAKVFYIANATTVPASNPTGGGVLYVEGGALKYRGSSGTVTTIAAA